MIERYRQFPFPLNVYAHLLVREGCGLQYLHYGLFENATKTLAEAQAYSTKLLLEKLLPPPAKLLEVGTGLGATMALLLAHGYDVTGVNPDPAQIAYAREHFNAGDRITLSLWEAFDAQGRVWDQVLFQESSQYIAPRAIFSGAAKCLAPGGKLLILDEVGLRRAYEGEQGLSLLGDLLRCANEAGFDLDDHLDVSKLAAPTVEHMLRAAEQFKDELLNDVGATQDQLDALEASNRAYREKYADGRYGYVRLLFTLRN